MPPPPSVREVADAYAAALRRLTEQAVAVLAVAARRGRGGPEAWRDAIATVATRLLGLQVAAASLADGYLVAALDAQGAGGAPEALVAPQAFAGLSDGGGSWLRTLVFAPVSVYERALTDRLGRPVALSRMQLVATSIVLTGMQDTARSSVQTAMFGHGANWYVRMLRGASCARCAVLAGRRYRARQAFRRHPRCDCVHVPMAEDHDDWSTDPAAYFRSLSPQQQDRIFTKAGAQAIRDTGVSQVAMNQIVNARQGITTVRAFGRDIRTTTTGTTKRALFGGYEIRADGSLRKRTDAELQKLPGRRYRTAKTPRLMPDEIYQLAEEFGWERAEVLRQLRRFGYLI